MASTATSFIGHGMQAHLENIDPHGSAVVDWVHQQPKSEQKPSAASTVRRSLMVTPPPKTRPYPDDNYIGASQVTPCPSTCRRPKIVYSIVQLLQLRETQCKVPVLLRVKPEAIAGKSSINGQSLSFTLRTALLTCNIENIFQYMGASNTNRFGHRSRPLSEISSFSRGSTTTNSNVAYSGLGQGSFEQDLRPAEISAQKQALPRKDGFVRFLIQHASPPHHRVTAGGRIVPAGPSSPPPMLDFASLNGLARERPAVARSSQPGSRHVSTSARIQNMQTPTMLSTPLNEHLPPPGHHVMGQTSLPMSNVQSGLPYGTLAYQPLTASMMQNAATMLPMAMFPDGSTLVSYGGVNYRAYWNGVNMIMEPLQNLPLVNDQQMRACVFQSSQSGNTLSGLGSDSARLAPPSNPTSSFTTISNRRSQSQSRSSTLNTSFTTDPLSNKEEILKDQLTKLDKYLALYHYDITAPERAGYIAQRRYLVEEIDRIRVSKEQPAKEQATRAIPIIEPNTGASAISSGRKSSKIQTQLADPSTAFTAALQVQALSDTPGKGLSPAAPAFVPKGLQEKSAAKLRMQNVSWHEKTSVRPGGFGLDERTQRSQNAFNIKDVANAAISRKSKAFEAENRYLKSFSHRQASSSSVLDPSDPAMRVIEYADIEYAGRYLYNWSQETKAYCTTVAEFQEAIRRVREQARIYGCEGGQSKDPAYDAEQDIWWAICDRDPIPVPSKVPDYVANPRPWNWNDSVFNYRRDGAPLPGPECDNARNSPRLAGWDPIITEAMKDKMDVSRSYYALKGLLPSVPFRTFAYDRHGNKVKIDSETLDSLCQGRKSSETVNKEKEAVLEANNKALKGVSTSDLNGRGPRLVRTPRNKASKKNYATDGDAVKPKSKSTLQSEKPKEASSLILDNCNTVTVLSKSKSRPGEANANNAGSKRKSSKIITAQQPAIGTQPQTPATRRMRADSKGSPTPKTCTLSKTVDKSSDPGRLLDNDQMATQSCAAIARDEASGVEHGILSDERTIDQTSTATTEATCNTYLPTEGMARKRDRQCAPSVLAECSVPQSDTSREVASIAIDVLAESRSMWNPEENLAPLRDGKHNPSQRLTTEPPRTTVAKVNIPNAAYGSMVQPGQYPPKLLQSEPVQNPTQQSETTSPSNKSG